MTKTSHKKNRPFDFKLIDLVEPHPVLYQRQSGLTTYETMKAKNVLWDGIAAEMDQPIQFCIMRWNNLRGQFQKELRRCRELCPKLGVIRGSTWPYLERLRFLESTVQYNKPKRERISKRQLKKQQQQVTEEQQQQTTIMNEHEDDTNLEWEDCDEFFASDSDMDNKAQITFFKEESQQSEQSHQPSEHQQQQQQNVVIDDSEFTMLTEIIVNSDVQICNEVPIEQQEQQLEEEISMIEEPVTIRRETHTENAITNTQSTTTNLQRMRWMLDGFDEINRLRCERRIMAFLCKVQLCSLYNQDINKLHI